MKVYNIYKRQGQTPLEALLKLKAKRKISQSLTYAGRLDPMAKGVLLILQGATQVQKEKFLALDKKYKVKILFGFSTDTFDLLGLPKKGVLGPVKKHEIEPLVKGYVGSTSFPIPAYSSVMHKGKPLFEWARLGKMQAKNLPKREMLIKSAKLVGMTTVSSVQLLKYIVSAVSKVNGDFRQDKILKAWKKLLSPERKKLAVATLEISCGSGTYIRSIADDLGKKLGTKATVYSLERLRVGKYKV